MTKRMVDGLHITRGPGRWIRLGSPSNQFHWSATCSCSVSPRWGFRKMTPGSPVGSCLPQAPGQVIDVFGTSGSTCCFPSGTAARDCWTFFFSGTLTLDFNFLGFPKFLDSSFFLEHLASWSPLFWPILVQTVLFLARRGTAVSRAGLRPGSLACPQGSCCVASSGEPVKKAGEGLERNFSTTRRPCTSGQGMWYLSAAGM